MAGTHGYQQLFTESVSTVTATNSVTLGTRRVESGVEYVYVYNAGTTAAVGYGMIQSLMSGFSVVVSSVSGDPCFGVVANTDLEATSYGWIAVRGPVHIDMAGMNHCTAATGMGILLQTNGSFYTVTTGATGSTWAQNKCGYTLTTINTASTGAAYITCVG